MLLNASEVRKKQDIVRGYKDTKWPSDEQIERLRVENAINEALSRDSDFCTVEGILSNSVSKNLIELGYIVDPHPQAPDSDVYTMISWKKE